VNVSIANAIRRVILSDLTTTVFRTAPYHESKATIHVNTTRENNEYIKQRLSCIPIHADYEELRDYVMELKVENDSAESERRVTTEDFRIRRRASDETTTTKVVEAKVVEASRVREIFPANGQTGDYIWFLTLQPKVVSTGATEKIHLECEFDVGWAREGTYAVASACAYGNTEDKAVQEKELAKLRQKWKDEGKTADEIVFEEENWILLEGKRFFKKDSFDFLVESVGVYSNKDLVRMACEELVRRFSQIKDQQTPQGQGQGQVEIVNAPSTLPNSFDIVLHGEDYTVGKVLEYFLYTAYFEKDSQRLLTYCGFRKAHPHDDFSVIRVAYIDAVDFSTVRAHLYEACDESIHVFKSIASSITHSHRK
jgi:DNA-directed RNA polymerase subunit L/DNA-directed RNA polymerase alpha subunit